MNAAVTTDDTCIARENHHRYIRARDAGHQKFITDAQQFEDFYVGEQWSAADKAKLEAVGRPAMTLNFTLPTVNAVVGEFVNQQADISFKPARGAASEAVAQDLTRLVMHISTGNDAEAVEKVVIEDAVITGRGYFDARIDFADNVLGEVRITALSPLEVLPDPTAREYDPKTWNEVTTTRWLSVDELVVLYGKEKGEKLAFYASAGALLNDDTIQWEERSTFGDREAFAVGDVDDVENGRVMKNVRVIERQYFKLSMTREFVDPVNGDTRPVPESWDDQRIAVYTELKGLQVRKVLKRRIRWTVSADCVLLHDGWSPYQTFTVVPFFCYFRRGRPFGVVKNLISPQEILNKAESQLLHVVNTTANSGWITETGALANMTVEELGQKGAETGLVIEVNPGRAVTKIQPNNVPSGLDRVGQNAAMSFQAISGVNAAMLGTENAEVSGVALENKQVRGALQLQTVRANLKHTRVLLARKILELVQAFYTEERVFHITGHEGEAEDLVINAQDTAGRIVNDLTLGEYEVVAGIMPARDVYDDVQFAEVIQLRDAGIMIPDYRVVQYSNLARKHEIADEVKQLTGMGDPTPEQQAMQEAQMKLLMAQVEQAIADVQKTQAEAQLAAARAQTEADKPALEREQMQAELAITATEQTTRMQVQRLKELSSQLQSALSANTKTRIEAHKAKTKPTPRKTSDERNGRR